MDDLEGYDVTNFDNYNGMEIGQPFYKVLKINARTDMKVVLVGAPLYKDSEYVKYWALLRAGYMPLGIMSFRSYPRIVPYEFETDGRIQNIKPEF